MTLPLNDRVTSTYTADGTNKEFNFDFRVFFNVDTGSYGLEVRKVIPGGYEVVSPSAYTVVPNEDLTAGKIIFTTAPVAGTEIYLAGKTPTVQQLNLTNYGRFSAEAIETNFDFITAIIQEWKSSLSIETAERIENDLLVNANTAALYAEWKVWAETNVPDFAATYLNSQIYDFRQQWIDALNSIAVGVIPALGVSTLNGENQQQVNDRIGNTWYDKPLGYELNARLMLENGDIVKSTVPNNTNDPNLNMTGWIHTEISIRKSVADMLVIDNPNNGQLVRTLSYQNGLSKGGNLYRYEPSRQLENDGGSVINGWVVQDKTTLTVWDFGYKIGDDDVSRTALSKALISTMPLRLVKETLSAHIGIGAGKDVLSQTITQNKVIFGQGRDVSVINGLRLQSQSDVLLAKDFSINANGLNYAIFVSAYDFILIDNFGSKGNLDAVLVMGAKSSQSKALVRNGYSENSSRVGFTSDIGAKNVTYEKCYSFNCRQGFHAEGEYNTMFIDCTADACGNSAMPPIDYQPPGYAGGFRIHKYSNVSLIRCKNINKNGTNRDQLGGGGTGLYIEKCEGLNFLADFGATETYRDIEVKGLKNGGIALESFSPKVAGRIIVHDFDGGSLELASITIDTINVVTYAEFVNVKADRLQIASQANDATIHMDNIYVRSPYFNLIKGFAHYVLGDLVYSWNNSGQTHYPNLGFRFNSDKAKTFTLQSFRTIGDGGGYHLSFENFPATCKPVIVSALDKDGAYNILSNVPYLHLADSQTRAAQATSTQLGQATYALNTQNKFLGRDVYNTTISKFMKASGSSATSTWVSYDGATTITPV